MNEQGTIYRTPTEIEAARLRGERLEYLDEQATQDIHGALNRHERRKRAKLQREVVKQPRRKR
jgi:hypothetical protein